MSKNEDIDNANKLKNESNSETPINDDNKIYTIEESDINEGNINNGLTKIKAKYNQTEIESKKISEKINKNNKKIEEINNILSKLKEEKNNKQLDIVNLLSKKETLEEIYKNQIAMLIRNNNIYKDLTNNNTSEKNNLNETNEYNNSDKNITNIENKINEQIEQFDLSIKEMKEIEIKKFIEQVISLIDDIYDKNFIKSSPDKNSENNKNEIIKKLGDIIKNSYNIFINNCSITDDEYIIYNFITKISLFISNQCFGKYSEKNINFLLRYLLKINIVNVEINKMVKFVKKKYKDQKKELKDEIKKIMKKNDTLAKKKKGIKKILNE